MHFGKVARYSNLSLKSLTPFWKPTPVVAADRADVTSHGSPPTCALVMVSILSLKLNFLSCSWIWAGEFERVGRDEALVGGELVHHRGSSARPLLGEADLIVDLKNALGQRCHPKELVSQSHLHLSPQFLLTPSSIRQSPPSPSIPSQSSFCRFSFSKKSSE